MNVYIVIPAHNEANYIGQTLDSLIQQQQLPKKVVIVNDNSTDATEAIIKKYTEQYDYIQYTNTSSSNEHLPGSKVIEAFYQGYELLDNAYDIILKLDADIILPENYLETIITHFKENEKNGMVGGFAYIEKNGTWVLENLTNKDHIRGAFKAYRKACFQDIGMLKKAMGWDTVDELLAQYHGWNIITDETLKVKHLKPTGLTYNKAARYKQGKAFYSLRYGFILTTIASLKLALLKKRPLLFFDYIIGYFKAGSEKTSYLVNPEEGTFIRNLRWKKIRQKVFK